MKKIINTSIITLLFISVFYFLFTDAQSKINAPQVGVGGYIYDKSGTGVNSATVKLIGVSFSYNATTTANSIGGYLFENPPTGQTYRIEVCKGNSAGDHPNFLHQYPNPFGYNVTLNGTCTWSD